MDKKLKRIKMKIVCLRNYIFLRFWAIFHPIEKKVLFLSFSGNQYSADPRAISEKLHKLYPDYKIVWSFVDKNKDDFLIPDYVKRVKNGFEFLKEFSTCAAFVTTTGITAGTYKRKRQFIVQTWHGDRGFKKIAYAAWADKNKKPAVNIIDNKVTDLCVAGSDHAENGFRISFKYYGEVLKVGMPRNDKLLNDDNEDEKSVIRKRLNIDENKKILLYAPTFRDNNKKNQTALIDIDETLSELNKKGGDWVCLVRAHFVSREIKASYNDNIINASNYPDMADLLLISDMLITDYSSCAGDFLLRKKPIILAAFDREEYVNNCRNFRTPIEKTGYFIAYDQNELNSIISEKTDKDFEENCEQVLAFYRTVETGNASEEVCNRINKAYQTYFN